MFRAFFHYLTLAATLTHFVFGCAIHHALGDCPEPCRAETGFLCSAHAGDHHDDFAADQTDEASISHGHECHHESCGHAETRTMVERMEPSQEDAQASKFHHPAVDCPCHPGENHSGCAHDSCTFMLTPSSDSLLTLNSDLLNVSSTLPCIDEASDNGSWKYFREDPASASAVHPLYALCSVFLL